MKSDMTTIVIETEFDRFEQTTNMHVIHKYP